MRTFFWGCFLVMAGFWVWGVQQYFVKDYVQKNFLPPLVESQGFNYDLRDYFLDNRFLDRAVDNWYEALSPQARVGQLIMPAWDEATTFDALKTLINSEQIGGFMILRKDFSVDEISLLKANNPNKVPLLVSVDAEPSLLKYRFTEPVFTGETADLITEKALTLVGKEISGLLQGYGINLNFAPVYDVGVNKTVIGQRAFSTQADKVIQRANFLARLWIRQNMIPTVKHFPGHGLVEGDTHETLETINDKLAEIPQFAAAIDAQMPVIMVGHLAVEGTDYDTQGLPSTLAPQILQKLLRQELNFEGVVITDAMNMQAVAAIPQASLKALQAGVDIVLMPDDPTALNQQVLDLVKLDPVFAKQIEQKVKRVLRLKLIWKMSAIHNI